MSTTGTLLRISIPGRAVAGIGLSRDDVVIGDEVTITDEGDGSDRVWNLIDQPSGSTVTISETGNPISFVPDKVGSYFLECIVDGGSADGDVYRIIAAVRIRLQPFAVDDKASLRIPAFGELNEFNTQPSFEEDPENFSPNTRGSARELEAWSQRIARYGFGVDLPDVSGGPWRRIFLNGADITYDNRNCRIIVDPKPSITPGVSVVYIHNSPGDSSTITNCPPGSLYIALTASNVWANPRLQHVEAVDGQFLWISNPSKQLETDLRCKVYVPYGIKVRINGEITFRTSASSNFPMFGITEGSVCFLWNEADQAWEALNNNLIWLSQEIYG
jgi:hypothetical protein